MNDAIRSLQRGLAGLGHDPGPIDGLDGPRTRAAALAYGAGKVPASAPVSGPADALPWMTEARVPFGWHEVRDNIRLRAWLFSDGKRLGDPKALPWCGDFVETAIKRGLPNEPFSGALAENPYWARNWITFGKRAVPTYGAVLVFERGQQSGHVAFAVGESDTDYFVLGGNQGDAVGITRLAKTRLLAARWPATWPYAPALLPRMSAGNIPQSVNEF